MLTKDVKNTLIQISKSGTKKASRVERAKVIFEYSQATTISAIARQLTTNRPKIEGCIDKALQVGLLTVFDDLPRSGKPPKITPEARTWLVNLACKNPQRSWATPSNSG